MPDDKAIQDDHKKSLADATEYVRKLQIISISSKEKEDDKEETESPEDVFIANQKLRELQVYRNFWSMTLRNFRTMPSSALNWRLE